MIIIIDKVSPKIRSLISAYFYGVSKNIFIGSNKTAFYDRFIKTFKKYSLSSDKCIFIISDTSFEGFSIEYINVESQLQDFDGLKLFRSLK